MAVISASSIFSGGNSALIKGRGSTRPSSKPVHGGGKLIDKPERTHPVNFFDQHWRDGPTDRACSHPDLNNGSCRAGEIDGRRHCRRCAGGFKHHIKVAFMLLIMGHWSSSRGSITAVAPICCASFRQRGLRSEATSSDAPALLPPPESGNQSDLRQSPARALSGELTGHVYSMNRDRERLRKSHNVGRNRAVIRDALFRFDNHIFRESAVNVGIELRAAHKAHRPTQVLMPGKTHFALVTRAGRIHGDCLTHF